MAGFFQSRDSERGINYIIKLHRHFTRRCEIVVMVSLTGSEKIYSKFLVMLGNNYSKEMGILLQSLHI